MNLPRLPALAVIALSFAASTFATSGHPALVPPCEKVSAAPAAGVHVAARHREDEATAVGASGIANPHLGPGTHCCGTVTDETQG